MAIFRLRGPGLGSPFAELERMRNYMESAYSALANGVGQLRRNYTGVFPLVNLAEDEDRLFVTAELPGIDPESLELTIKGDTLALKGTKRTGVEGAEVNYHRREREGGTFRRSLTLPVKVQADAVEAGFKNGILTVTLPKAAEARAHQITVKNL
jgi:HSP20 family protein